MVCVLIDTMYLNDSLARAFTGSIVTAANVF